MGDNECSLALNINKTVLVNTRSITCNHKLNHVSPLLGCSNVKCNVLKNAVFDCIRINNNNLTVVSHHNSQGAIVINDTIDAQQSQASSRQASQWLLP
jgi:hypothetical protein